jgi:hypothetical protein
MTVGRLAGRSRNDGGRDDAEATSSCPLLYSPPATSGLSIQQIARDGEKRNACGIMVGNPEGKRPLKAPRRWWVDTIKMDLNRDNMGWYGLD